MKIGLDLSIIQTPHRMRGIGATAINFVKNIPETHKKKHTFVLYLYKEGQKEALSILDLTGIAYEIRPVENEKKVSLRVPRKLAISETMLTHVRDSFYSYARDPRIRNGDDLDVFLQFDQMQNLPRLPKTKVGVMLYDLIPYVMEADYLWSYKTARRNLKSRKGAARQAFLRRKYITKARAIAKKADVLFAISQHTKDDFIKYAGVEASKIKVIHLGINTNRVDNLNNNVLFERYLENSWGSFPEPINLNEKPFLLFIGGADPRRKLVDLVAAYNILKAQGHDIRLVFAGDTMRGASSSPVLTTQQYITSSSYLDDIAFLGFVTDEQREWLYANALAFVYPSVYEGFGLPILEAMQYGTPVITYENTSIYEVAGDAAIYASDALSIKNAVEKLLSDPAAVRKYAQAGEKRAAKYSWKSTSQQILDELSV
jgi:glycosyltransferase involved in cell wall biosynthesis